MSPSHESATNFCILQLSQCALGRNDKTAAHIAPNAAHSATPEETFQWPTLGFTAAFFLFFFFCIFADLEEENVLLLELHGHILTMPVIN